MTQPQDTVADQSKEQFRPTVDTELDQSIEEAMGGLSMDQLIASDGASSEGEERIKGIRTGYVFSIDLGKGEILIALDGKNQGVAPLDQFVPEPRVGEAVEVAVERFDERQGIYKLNKKGAAVSSSDIDNINPGMIVEGQVDAMNKGGLELKIGTLRAFMPAGQVDVHFHKDISVFLGQKMKVVVQKVDRRGKQLVVSRRQIVEQERAESKKKLLEEISEGQTRRGTISSVMEYGAFVDLGGADGLIHISELTHRRGVKATDIVQVGDLVDVKIVKLDPETGKIGLSLKQLMADPWAGAEAKYSVGTEVTGRVVRIEGFGAFIEVEEGFEGLLPISEVSYQRVNRVSDVLKPDDIIKLSVIALDTVNRKLTLSLKQSGPDPWKTAASKYNKYDVVPGKVTRTVDFGAFIELEPGLEGLVHISELADHRVKSVGEVVKPGQDVEALVLEVDSEKRRISLSLKKAKAEFVPPPEPVKEDPKKPRKPKQLRGGLESGWFK